MVTRRSFPAESFHLALEPFSLYYTEVQRSLSLDVVPVCILESTFFTHRSEAEKEGKRNNGTMSTPRTRMLHPWDLRMRYILSAPQVE